MNNNLPIKKVLKEEDLQYILSCIEDKALKEFIKNLIEVRTIKDHFHEVVLSNIKGSYDYDYTYTSDDGHPVDSHKKIVPSFKYVVEIFSDLVEHDSENYYQNFYGPNKNYIMAVWEEIKTMEHMKGEIERDYKDEVKCILSDWNEDIQYGCVLYVYIL